MRAFLFIAVVASLFYALDQSMKTHRQKRFAEMMAEKEEARARTNAIYYAKVKAEAELAQKRLIAEENESQRKFEAGMAKIEQEFQEKKAQRDAQSAREHEARLRRDLATIRELSTPTRQPSYNPLSNPMSAENMAAQGMRPSFWATPKESPAPAVPQDFEIEERGNFWFGSDGSGGHIRRSPSGRTIYGR